MAAPDEFQWDPALCRLADAIKPDFHLIDAVWERLREKYRVPIARSMGFASDREFLLVALGFAQNTGLLRAFARGLMHEQLVEETFDARLLAIVGPSAYELQAFQNGIFRPRDAFKSSVLMGRACEHVCRIDIKEEHAGTGVLVRPTLVATAAHVVWPLVDCLPNGTLRPKQDSLSRLRLTFSDFEDYLKPEQKQAVRAQAPAALHEDWLAWGSKATLNELSKAAFDVRDIVGISHIDGPWDLVLIRLAEPRVQADNPLLPTDPPSEPYQIHVLHHPVQGSGVNTKLLWSIGKLDEQLGNPAVRCLHDANTLGGSSGAPVFDGDWKIVALHQGGSRDLRHHADATRLRNTDRNRAVPVRFWSRRLDQVERLREHVPYLPQVVGRRETQERIWRGIQPGADRAERVLIIRGEPGTGLRYTKRIVRQLVTTKSDGIVATLDATNTLQDGPMKFAERVVGALAAQLDVPESTGVTTTHSEVRRTIAPTLGMQLEGLAGARPVWVVIEGLDRATGTEQSGIHNLLLGLVNSLGEHPSLRLVLVGWPQTPPDDFLNSVENLTPPTAADVAIALLPPGAQPPDKLVEEAGKLLAAKERAGFQGYDAAREAVDELRLALAQRGGER